MSTSTIAYTTGKNRGRRRSPAQLERDALHQEEMRKRALMHQSRMTLGMLLSAPDAPVQGTLDYEVTKFILNYVPNVSYQVSRDNGGTLSVAARETMRRLHKRYGGDAVSDAIGKALNKIAPAMTMVYDLTKAGKHCPDAWLEAAIEHCLVFERGAKPALQPIAS